MRLPASMVVLLVSLQAKVIYATCSCFYVRFHARTSAAMILISSCATSSAAAPSALGAITLDSFHVLYPFYLLLQRSLQLQDVNVLPLRWVQPAQLMPRAATWLKSSQTMLQLRPAPTTAQLPAAHHQQQIQQ
jgi:hypothetical protein